MGINIRALKIGVTLSNDEVVRRLEALCKYYNDNGSLPNKGSGSYEEKLLAAWIYEQHMSYKNGTISQKRLNLIRDYSKDIYDYVVNGGSLVGWKDNHQYDMTYQHVVEIRDFMADHLRLPSLADGGRAAVNRKWIYRVRYKFSKGVLNQGTVNLLNTLTPLILEEKAENLDKAVSDWVMDLDMKGISVKDIQIPMPRKKSEIKAGQDLPDYKITDLIPSMHPAYLSKLSSMNLDRLDAIVNAIHYLSNQGIDLSNSLSMSLYEIQSQYDKDIANKVLAVKMIDTVLNRIDSFERENFYTKLKHILVGFGFNGMDRRMKWYEWIQKDHS